MYRTGSYDKAAAGTGKLPLQSIADRDWLTGLYNRGAMERKVNERYGHIAGDELLSLVGTVLNKMSGSRRTVCAWEIFTHSTAAASTWS